VGVHLSAVPPVMSMLPSHTVSYKLMGEGSLPTVKERRWEKSRRAAEAPGLDRPSSNSE
jgi:hypothetical protein